MSCVKCILYFLLKKHPQRVLFEVEQNLVNKGGLPLGLFIFSPNFFLSTSFGSGCFLAKFFIPIFSLTEPFIFKGNYRVISIYRSELPFRPFCFCFRVINLREVKFIEIATSATRPKVSAMSVQLCLSKTSFCSDIKRVSSPRLGAFYCRHVFSSLRLKEPLTETSILHLKVPISKDLYTV